MWVAGAMLRLETLETRDTEAALGMGTSDRPLEIRPRLCSSLDMMMSPLSEKLCSENKFY